GAPIGSAMPLCWAHAEYLTLVRSQKDGVGFDRIEPVYDRYAKAQHNHAVEIWTLAHQPPNILHGKPLRIITSAPSSILWTFDDWTTVNDTPTKQTGFGCWFVDLPADQLPKGAKIIFTIRWGDRWEGRDFVVSVT